MLTLADLRPGDLTAEYKVTAHPQRQADGSLRIPVVMNDELWPESKPQQFVSGDPADAVIVLHRGSTS